MKLLITKITICCLCFGILLSCAIDPSNKIRGNGNVISQERKVTASFDKITVSQGIKLYIAMEKEASIHVEADENLHEHIKTEIKSGVLKVYFDGNISFSKTKNVYISLPNIQSIKASSGSYVTSENILMSKYLELKTSSGASMEIDVDTDTLFAKTASGSSIELKGKTNTYNSEASSGSTIDSYELISTSAIAKASSGSVIRLFVKDELDAKASSGGSIKYKGKPQSINKKSASGGRVSQQ